MTDIPGTEVVEIPGLLDRVRALSRDGLRFVTATCLDHGDHFELHYHFDANLQMTHLKMVCPRGSIIPSITGVYLAAFLIENEMKELFGIDITGIAIDYQGRLYLTDDSAPAPMAHALAGRDSAGSSNN